MIPFLIQLTDIENGQDFICNMTNVQSVGLSPSKSALASGTPIIFNDRSFVFVAEPKEQVVAYYNQTLYAILGGVYEFWKTRLLDQNPGQEQPDTGDGTSTADQGTGQA